MTIPMRRPRFLEALMRSRRVPVILATAVAALYLSGAASAQPAPPPQTAPTDIERLGFDEAVARAIEKNTDVAQAAQAILQAEALLQQARVVYKPTAGATVNLTVLDKERGFDEFVTQPRTQGTFAGSVSYPILSASRWAAATQARDQVEIARLSAADVRRQVATATGQAYLSVINEQRQVAVNTVALENAQAHVDYARSRLEAGAGSKLNELRASQELATDAVLLEASRLALRRSQEALGVLLAADKPLDAASEPAFEIPTAPGDESWLAQRADVQLFGANVTAADRVWRDSWKDWVPTASASWQPQWIHPAGLFAPSRTWQAVIGVDIPVFDGGERRAVKRQRQIARDTFQLQLDDLRLRVRAELRTAQAAVDSTERAVGNARLAAQHAAEVVRITDVAFRAGATTNLEVIDAQRGARDADTAAAQAEDQVRRARLDLLVALGLFPK
jgi:outer membrane protein